MIVRVNCTELTCTRSIKTDSLRANEVLRRYGMLGFWQHVSDERAFVIRATMMARWGYPCGEIGKSTISMPCPEHRGERLELEEDVVG